MNVSREEREEFERDLRAGSETAMDFKKYDKAKPRYSLIPPRAEEEMVKVLTFGAKKYSADNWRKVDDPNRYVDAAMRHIAAYRKGEKLDSESNLHHLAHAVCCLAFIVELEKEND